MAFFLEPWNPVDPDLLRKSSLEYFPDKSPFESGENGTTPSPISFAMGIIPKLADPDSSCVNSSGTSIAKKYSGPMRYGHSAQAPTLAKMRVKLSAVWY